MSKPVTTDRRGHLKTRGVPCPAIVELLGIMNPKRPFGDSRLWSCTAHFSASTTHKNLMVEHRGSQSIALNPDPNPIAGSSTSVLV